MARPRPMWWPLVVVAFDPHRYWEDRHAEADGLSGVGYLGLRGYNDWMYRVRRRVFRRVLRPYLSRLPGAKVLDVGSGTGFYVDLWQRIGAGHVTAADFSEVACQQLADAFPRASVEQFDITTDDRGRIDAVGTFDFVSIIDVLYHVVDDALYERAFENLASLLAPDGLLIFTENFLQNVARSGSDWQVSREMSEIEGALSRAGLEIEARVPWFVLMNGPVDSTSRIHQRAWWLVRKLSERSSLAAYLLGAGMYPTEVALTKILRESPTSEIAIARRRR